jgi:hypothetical protein
MRPLPLDENLLPKLARDAIAETFDAAPVRDQSLQARSF